MRRKPDAPKCQCRACKAHRAYFARKPYPLPAWAHGTANYVVTFLPQAPTVEEPPRE